MFFLHILILYHLLEEVIFTLYYLYTTTSTDLTVIRPLMYVSEADVKGFCNKYQLPVVKSPCPANGYTKRQYVKDLLRKLNQENPGVKERMFSAIVNGNIPDWTPKIR